jgi:hypothetical protein
VCQNINSYLGGSKNIWRNSGNNIGVTGSSNESDFNEEEKKSLINSVNCSQKFDDKQLEFFIYDTGVEVGLENIYSGHAHKIYHGEGPIRIVFRKGSKGKLYVNIDGEYFRIYEPEYIKIVNNINLSNGQINFLRRSGGEFFESSCGE